MRVHRTTWLSSGVVQLELRDIDGAQLPEWQPGAHVVLNLPNGLQRQYSLCGDPADRQTWTIAVLHERDSRGGSSWVHERLTAGAVLEVDGPNNNFPLEDAEGYLFIAGGIGITPLLPMMRSAAASGSSWSALYCGRSRDSMAFVPELLDLSGDRLTVHADDEHGSFPDLASTLAGLAPGSMVYCCGPEQLITAVEQALPEQVDLRIERFRAPEPAPGCDSEAGFDVVCAGSNERVTVAEDMSILDALEDAGLDMPFSCREGVCGSCETKVLSGEPEHRDFVLSESEKASNSTMLVCVSRARSGELVLDLG